MAESTWKEKHPAAPPDTGFLRISTRTEDSWKMHISHTEKKKTTADEYKGKPQVSFAAEQQMWLFNGTFADAFLIHPTLIIDYCASYF